MANITYRITDSPTIPVSSSVKAAPLTNAEIDGNFKSLDDAVTSTNIAKYNATTANFTGTLQNGGSDVLVDTDIDSTVQSYDANTAKYNDITSNFTGTLQNGGSNVLVDTDISSTVQAYDANTAKYDDVTSNFTGTLQNGGSNVLVDTDIDSTVQSYDANTAKYNDTTSNFTGTLQNGGSDVLVDTDISSTVQAYDANLTTWAGKTAPTGTVVGTSDSQTLTNKTLTSVILDGGYSEEIYAITGTTPALDPANGTIQTWTLTGSSTPTDSIAAGESITLMIDDGTAYSITWPTMTWVNNAGSAPTLATSGYTVVGLWKVGSTLYGALVGDGT